ncbi:MAG: NAD-dependent epimerase/dehydratase family protein [Saprospiraceae bacterium]
MKIFITGASGFIGGAVTKALVSKHKVSAMARSEKSANIVAAIGARAVMCSLNNVEASHLQGVDVVIHSAAYVESWGTKQQFWEMNVNATKQLLAVARKAGVKRFVHISTEACLFHGQAMVNIDETYPYAEHTPYLYSMTKREAEKLVVNANDTGVFDTVTVRPRMVWGPDDKTILPEVLKLVDSGAFSWINHGKAMTSITYIGNLVEGILLAMEKGRAGEIYFITDSEQPSVKEFLTGLLLTQNITPSSKSVPSYILRPLAYIVESVWRLFNIKKDPFITRFAADIMSVECTINIDKARKELGYQPQISFKEGLKAMKH